MPTETTLDELFDIAVVGAGPCGLGVGVAAQQGGASCVLFEKASVVSAISRYPTHMTFFSTAEKLELGGVPFISQGDKPNRKEALRYYQRIARHFALDVHQYEEVTSVSGTQGDFSLATRRKDGSTNIYSARNVVIATGYLDTPCLLGIAGEDQAHVTHYYKEGSTFFDQDCLVIGAGNSAVDAALDLHRWGARVTLLHFAESLDAGVKPWILPDIANRMKSGEIGVLWRTRVVEIRASTVVLERDGELQEVATDFVFAMTGYKPDPLLLQSLGVAIDTETGIPAYDRATMQTPVPGVFVAGVLAAGCNANKIFIENGREHGPLIVATVKGEQPVKARADGPRTKR